MNALANRIAALVYAASLNGQRFVVGRESDARTCFDLSDCNML